MFSAMSVAGSVTLTLLLITLAGLSLAIQKQCTLEIASDSGILPMVKLAWGLSIDPSRVHQYLISPPSIKSYCSMDQILI